MAEGVNIRVRAEGAAETKQALGEVADAEKRVAQATSGGAVQHRAASAQVKTHAQATAELAERNRTLTGRLRALGPEFGVVGDMIEALTLKQGAAAVMVGVLGAAILGITLAVQKWTAAQEAEKREAREILDLLGRQRDAYAGLEASVNAVAQAEARRRGGGPSGAAEAIVGRVAAIGAEVPLGKEGIGAVSKAIAAARQPLTAEEERLFAMWYATGGAEGLSDAQAVAVFRAMISGNPAAAADLQKRLDASIAGAPAAAGAARHEARMVTAGMTPGAEAEAIFKQVAEQETAAGRKRTSEDIRRYVASLVSRVGTPDEEGWAATRRKLELPEAERILDRYPDLGRVEMVQNTDPRAPLYRPVGAGERGRAMTQIIYAGGVHTHIHGQDDPAGVPVPGSRGNTGR